MLNYIYFLDVKDKASTSKHKKVVIVHNFNGTMNI